MAAVYVYGSHATGKDNPGSDVDIAVLEISPPMEKNKADFEERRKMQADLSRLLRRDVDLVFMRDIGEALLAEVFKRGKVAYEGDVAAHSIFRVSALGRCMDFRLYQTRMHRGMVEAMRRERVG